MGVLPLDKLPDTREAYDTELRAKGFSQYRAGYLPQFDRRRLAADSKGLCLLAGTNQGDRDEHASVLASDSLVGLVLTLHAADSRPAET